MFSFCNINSQNETVNQRAKSGDLTLAECLDRRVLEQGTDIVPSLLKIKNGLENNNHLDCQTYILVVEALCNYYTNKGDYYSAKMLLNNSMKQFNIKVSSPNNEYTRKLWIF